MADKKVDKRGHNTVENWQRLKKGGQLAPCLDNVSELITDVDNHYTLSHDELVSRIIYFFKSCTEVTIDEAGNEVTKWKTAPTKNMLALCLGISREALTDTVSGLASNKKPISKDNPAHNRRIAIEDIEIVKRAYMLIESYYEGSLVGSGSPVGSIFWLLNSRTPEWSNDHTSTIIHKKEVAEPLTADELPQLSEIVTDAIELHSNDDTED